MIEAFGVLRGPGYAARRAAAYSAMWGWWDGPLRSGSVLPISGDPAAGTPRSLFDSVSTDADVWGALPAGDAAFAELDRRDETEHAWRREKRPRGAHAFSFRETRIGRSLSTVPVSVSRNHCDRTPTQWMRSFVNRSRPAQ